MSAGGKISPITVLTPAPSYWALWLRFTWFFADRSRFIKRPLLALEFIHVAHWGLVGRVPQNAERRHRRPLPRTYIVFQSNFDGPAQEYAEAFAIKVPGRIYGMWGRATGFPGPRPWDRFVRYVLDHAVNDARHYYAAYPVAGVREVNAALALREPFGDLVRRAPELEPDQLLAAWQRFLTDEQRHL